MLRYLTADIIYKGDGSQLHDHILVINERGEVHDLCPMNNVHGVHVEMFEGALIPGMVNTHCHLELSHMKDLVSTGTTLLPFLESVV